MRIGIDAGLFPRADLGGLAIYRRELVAALAREPGDEELVVYGREPPIPAGPHARPIRAVDLGGHPLARLPGVYRQVLLPLAVRRDALDVVHYPLGSASLFAGRPAVVSVHDLLAVRSSSLAYPVPLAGLRFRARKRWHRWAIPAALRRARLVLASSAATRDDVIALAGVVPERVRVVPLAVADRFREPVDPARVAAFAATHGYEAGAVLALASIDPRKNVHRLVAAYARLPERLRARHALVVLMTQPTQAATLHAWAARHGVGERLRLVPFLLDEEVPCFYATGRVLAFPSLHEGFGLPVLECLTGGVPVVAGAVGGLPEVGGDAVRWVDPTDAGALAAALAEVLDSEERRARMVAAGRRAAERFSWSATARATLAAYREAAR